MAREAHLMMILNTLITIPGMTKDFADVSQTQFTIQGTLSIDY
jgi:hypothetical protein